MSARLRSLQARLFPNGILDVVRQVALFAIAYYGYRLVRGSVDDPQGAAIAFQHGRDLIDVERSLHVFWEPKIQDWSSGLPIVNDIAAWLYVNAQITVTVSSLVYLYLRHNDSFYFVRNMFFVAMAIAIAGYILYPTAPPRFFPEWGFVDSVSDYFGTSHQSSVNALFNPYAAVPSMHVAFALMIGWPLARLVKWRAAKVFWSLYPLLMTFVIVSTANHFIADAVLGAVAAALSAYAAAWLARARPAVWAFSPARSSATA